MKASYSAKGHVRIPNGWRKLDRNAIIKTGDRFLLDPCWVLVSFLVGYPVHWASHTTFIRKVSKLRAKSASKKSPTKRLPKFSGKWVTPDIAKKWPEGIMVLKHRPNRSKLFFGYLELDGYHRPDLIDLKQRNGTLWYMRVIT